MSGVANKWCFVPTCRNTSVNAPNNNFIGVPKTNYSRRMKWFEAETCNVPKLKSKFYCCEDHFNLEEDMKNYMRYKLMGGYMILKEDVVAHIFAYQPDRKRDASAPERSLPLKPQREQLVKYALMQETNSIILEDISPVTDYHQSKSTEQGRLDEHVMKHVYQQDDIQIVLAKNMETICNEREYLSPVDNFDQPSTSTDQVSLDADEHVLEQFYQQDIGQIIQTKSVRVQVKPSNILL